VKMGQIRCPETSENNYHTTPRNTPEYRRFQQISLLFLVYTNIVDYGDTIVQRCRRAGTGYNRFEFVIMAIGSIFKFTVCETMSTGKYLQTFREACCFHLQGIQRRLQICKDSLYSKSLFLIRTSVKTSSYTYLKFYMTRILFQIRP
jgi:hypothetical protein